MSEAEKLQVLEKLLELPPSLNLSLEKDWRRTFAYAISAMNNERASGQQAFEILHYVHMLFARPVIKKVKEWLTLFQSSQNWDTGLCSLHEDHSSSLTQVVRDYQVSKVSVRQSRTRDLLYLSSLAQAGYGYAQLVVAAQNDEELQKALYDKVQHQHRELLSREDDHWHSRLVRVNMMYLLQGLQGMRQGRGQARQSILNISTDMRRGQVLSIVWKKLGSAGLVLVLQTKTWSTL